ncbi:MAG: HPr family phosphocarrier protein [Alphaproteobacteria bacterium]
MESTQVTIINQSGLHTRPGKDFVQLAKKYESKIIIVKDAIEYNGKSLLKLMKAGISKGEEITIKADGEDEKAAIEALKSYVENLDPEA